MSKRTNQPSALTVTEEFGPAPVCDDSPYSKTDDGEYEAMCMDAKIYRDPRFKRWVCRMRYKTVPDGLELFGFLNLGTGDKPQVKRGSEYRHVWTIANGDAPRKRQALSASKFVGKIFLVKVGKTTRRHDHRDHHDAEVYSTVKAVLMKKWG